MGQRWSLKVPGQLKNRDKCRQATRNPDAKLLLGEVNGGALFLAASEREGLVLCGCNVRFVCVVTKEQERPGSRTPIQKLAFYPDDEKSEREGI